MSLLQTFAHDTFSPLRNRNFAIYMGGQTVSLIGTWMQTTAQQWLVWELTKINNPAGDTRMVGLVGALGFAPLFFLGPFTGAIADRYDRRKLLIATQTASMLLAFVLSFLVYRGLTELWPVMVMATLLGIVSSLDFPAQSAFIGDVAGMGEVRKAVSLNASMFQLGRMIGPTLAGLVVAQFGTAPAFLINGVSFIAVIFSLVMVRSTQTKRVGMASPLKEFAEAVKYARSQPRIIDLLISGIVVTLFVFSVGSLIAPFADTVLKGGAETLGYLSAASGFGAVLGALVVAPQVQKFPRVGVGMIVALVWAGAWLVVNSFATWLPMALICGFFISLVVPVVLAGANGLIQISAPPHMRARLISFWQMTSFGSQPVGAIVTGFMASVIGVLGAYRVNGIALIAAALGILVFRAGFRDWVVVRAPNSAPGAAKPAVPLSH